MEGIAIMIGLLWLGLCIDNGLCEIARSIKSRTLDVNLKMPPIKVMQSDGDNGECK